MTDNWWRRQGSYEKKIITDAVCPHGERRYEKRKISLGSTTPMLQNLLKLRLLLLRYYEWLWKYYTVYHSTEEEEEERWRRRNWFFRVPLHKWLGNDNQINLTDKWRLTYLGLTEYRNLNQRPMLTKMKMKIKMKHDYWEYYVHPLGRHWKSLISTWRKWTRYVRELSYSWDHLWRQRCVKDELDLGVSPIVLLINFCTTDDRCPIYANIERHHHHHHHKTITTIWANWILLKMRILDRCGILRSESLFENDLSWVETTVRTA